MVLYEQGGGSAPKDTVYVCTLDSLMNCGSPVIGSYVRFSMQVQFYVNFTPDSTSIVSLIVNPAVIG